MFGNPPPDLPNGAFEQLRRVSSNQLPFDHLVQHVQALLFFLIQRDVLPHFPRVTKSLDN